MELRKANDLFKEAREAMEGRREDGTPCVQDHAKAEALLNELLDNNVGNPLIVYMLATLHMTHRRYGLAVQLLTYVVKHQPEFGEAWNNLGLSYKDLNNWDNAAQCAIKAAELLNHPDVMTNAAACHLGRATPEIALDWCDRALALSPNHLQARWHKGMALLEMGRFEEAWDWHESRMEGGGNYSMTPRNYHGAETTPKWDGRTPGTVVIHGEQGMGDEVMFASCMRDALATGARIILEPSPRLEGLFRRSFPGCDLVFGTDDTDGAGWIEERGAPDFKCAIGTLPSFYRRSLDAFPGTPYLVADPKRMEAVKARLWALGRRPKVGIAWQGGVPSTRCDARSFHPRLFGPMLVEHDVDWISLQYDWSAAQCAADVRNETGVDIHHWPEYVEARDPATGKPSSMDDLAALIAGLDLVITVPQTCYHIAGALGVPCVVLTQSEPDWRLGVAGDTVPWYSSVRLIRQAKGTRNWQPVILEASRRIEGLLSPQRAKAM